MDVVSSEASLRSGLPYELLYSDDLIVDGETYGCVELLLSGRHS